MKARNLFSGSAYGPERLKHIYRAFDRAWDAIKPVIENTPLAHEAARLKLANMIMDVAAGEGGDQHGERRPVRRASPVVADKKSSA